MKESRAVFVGFLAAALLPTVTAGVLGPGIGDGYDVVTILVFGVLFYTASVAVGAAFGMPMLALLRRFDLVRWWTASISGLLVVTLATQVFAYSTDRLTGNGVVMLITWALTGFASGLVFWFVWRTGTPRPTDGGSK